MSLENFDGDQSSVCCGANTTSEHAGFLSKVQIWLAVGGENELTCLTFL